MWMNKNKENDYLYDFGLRRKLDPQSPVRAQEEYAPKEGNANFCCTFVEYDAKMIVEPTVY